MKLVLAITTGLLFSIIVHGQETERCFIGADVTAGLTEKKLTMMVGYAFGERWSAEGRLGISMNALTKKPDRNETEHENEFSQTDGSEQENPDRGHAGISISFWPESVYRGCCFFIGGNIIEGGIPDLMLGIGYSIQLWKGLSVILSLNLDLQESWNRSSRKTQPAGIGLCYIF